jgi:hypothetical protein
MTTANITNLSFAGATAPASSSYTYIANPTKPNGNTFGSFGYALDCGACGNGTSPPDYNGLTFDITNGSNNLPSSAFTTSGKGYYFVSDIGIYNGANWSNTGVVGATGPTQTTNQYPVPEPISLSLLGSGLVGLGIARRRRA